MKFNFSLDDMRLFWLVAEYGSFSKAAKAVSMPAPTLSRRISRLEESLGIVLLNRDAHRVEVTSIGQQYLARCAHIFSELDTVADELYKEKNDAAGTIRIAAPVQLSTQKLNPLFNAFLIQHPKIKFELYLSDKSIDMIDEFIDFAFRADNQVEGEWISRPFLDVKILLCASAKQTQWHKLESLEQLDQWPVILNKPFKTWDLIDQETNKSIAYEPKDNVRLSNDDVSSGLKAVLAGLGVSFLPDFVAEEKIKSGELVVISERFIGEDRTLNMVYRDRDNQPYRLRLLIDFMRQHASVNPQN